MRRLGALFFKDVREHAWLLASLAMFLPFCWLLIALVAWLAPTTMSYIDVHGGFLRLFLVLSALAIGNRLVVAEYHGRTQLFLESLPIGRFDVFVVKLLFGAVLLEIIAFASLGGSIALALTREPFDGRFFAILAARTLVFTLFVWCFFFLMGFLGRFRVPIYVSILLVLMVIASKTELELVRFGPFSLAGLHIATDHANVPTEELLVTLSLCAFFLVLAAVLATVREGSLAETLAKRMSQRERVTIGVLLASAFMLYMHFDPPDARAPYQFPSDHVARSSSPPIEIFYVEDDARVDAEALLARLVRELPPLADALGWDALPMVHVELAERLDGATYEPVPVGEDDGVLLRANFRRTEEYDEDALVAQLVGATIDDHTDQRSYWEPNGWVRDGFSEWWPRRDASELPRHIVLRALWSTRARGVDPARLRDWDLWREREGWEVTESLAATGIQTLEDVRGQAAVFALARALFEETPPHDSRPVIESWIHPVAQRVHDATGLSVSEVSAAWSAWLAARRSSFPSSLERFAHAEADVVIEANPHGARDLVARIHVPDPLPPGSTASLLYLGLGPFDNDVWPWDPDIVERSWPEGANEAEVRVPGRYGPGERVWGVIDVSIEGAEIRAPMRIAYERLEVR